MTITFDAIAQGCRTVIIGCLLLLLFVTPLNAFDVWRRSQKAYVDKWEVYRSWAKAFGTLCAGGGLLYGTYTRLDQEFQAGLVPMALGLVVLAVIEYVGNGAGGGDDRPKAFGAMADAERMIEEARP